MRTITVDANINKWIGTQNGPGKFQQLSNLKIFYNLIKQVFVSNVMGITIDRNGDLLYVPFSNDAIKIRNGNY